MAGPAGPALCFCRVERKRSQESSPGPESQRQLQLSIWGCYCPGAFSGSPTLPGSLQASSDRVSPALLPLMSPTPTSILSRTRAHLPAGHFPACFYLPNRQSSFRPDCSLPRQPKAKSVREWWAFKALAWAKFRGSWALPEGLLPLSGKQRVSCTIAAGLREKYPQNDRASRPESTSRSLWAGLLPPPSPRGPARGRGAGRPPVAAQPHRSGPMEGGTAAAEGEGRRRRQRRRGGHGGVGAGRALGPGRDFLRARRVGSAEPLSLRYF
uniref:RWD domain-containing protein 3 isoform X3 n=1 Tax=Panthera onca TaxID=9690 RepID=UPI0029558555|nr:RWD domain-containing protein 3 isoform X3 [Panthera onca]